MGIRQRLLVGVARQLRQPQGLRGRFTARGLNRGNRTAVLAAVAATGLEAGQTAADLGFGGGVGLRPLLDRVGPGGHIHGVDFSDTMVAMGRRQFSKDIVGGRLTLHAGNLVDLPLPDESLDAVITVNTLYFVDDLAQAFSEIFRVLRPGGRAVIGIGDPDAMAAMSVTSHGFTIRPVDELVALLCGAGFAAPRDERVGDDPRGFHLLLADRTS